MNRGRLVVVGTGPGPGYLTRRAGALMRSCDAFVGGRDALAQAPAWGRHLPVRGSLDPILTEVETLLQAGEDVCIVTSGDPGYFSLLAAVERTFPGEAVVEPGISSTQLLCARLGLSWTEVGHHSVHGRALELEPGDDRPFAVLCDPAQPPEAVAALLVARGCRGQAAVGSSLGREAEHIFTGELGAVAQGNFASPAVLLVCPDDWLARSGARLEVRSAGGVADAAAGDAGVSRPAGIPDASFTRLEGVPLSRWEVRAVLAAVAVPHSRGVIWDVGAGSGGFAVELALAAPFSRVVAFEREPDGCQATVTNARKLGARVEVVEGSAPAAFQGRPDGERPDLVVIGGSGGGLEGIVAALAELVVPGGRLVVTAVTLETLGAATALLKKPPWVGFDALQLSSARLDRAGILKGMNPVTLLWADKEAS